MTISSVGSSASLAQMRQLQQAAAFKTADADGDGQLSLNEFQSVGQNLQGPGEGRGPPPMRGGGGPGGHFGGETLAALLSTQSTDSSASLMDTADADADGLLSASELSSAIAANAPEGADTGMGLEDKMAEDLIKAFDADGNGGLSSDEIASAISSSASNSASAQASEAPPPPPPGPPPGGAGRASSGAGSSGVFEGLDTNRDGVVSADELAAAQGSDSADAASASSDLIKAADQDGDGSLNGDEFYAMLKDGQSTSTDASTTTIASLMSGSTAAADLMQKLLAQLESALTTSSTSTASSGSNVTA